MSPTSGGHRPGSQDRGGYCRAAYGPSHRHAVSLGSYQSSGRGPQTPRVAQVRRRGSGTATEERVAAGDSAGQLFVPAS